MIQGSVTDGEMHMNAIKPETSSLHYYRVINFMISRLVSSNDVGFLITVNLINAKIIPDLSDLI